jgi:hypothetical protein
LLVEKLLRCGRRGGEVRLDALPLGELALQLCYARGEVRLLGAELYVARICLRQRTVAAIRRVAPLFHCSAKLASHGHHCVRA